MASQKLPRRSKLRDLRKVSSADLQSNEGAHTTSIQTVSRCSFKLFSMTRAFERAYQDQQIQDPMISPVALLLSALMYDIK